MTAIRAGIEFEATPAVHPATPHAFWTLHRAVQALDSQLITAPRFDHRALSGVSTDTRTLSHGALFVALRGPSHDAHDWLAQARDAGAAAVVVDRGEAAAGLGLPVIVVQDTLVALGQLARAWRRAWGGTVVAVGGSNGKTSTKEMLRAAIGARLDVHATEANHNNLIGVPLTLLAIPPHAQVAVVEVGTNTPGEIAQLRAICEPDIAVITSIGEEHLEGLGDLAGVLREEAELLRGVPMAVVPVHEEALITRARAPHTGAQRVMTAGVDAGDMCAQRATMQADGHMALRLHEVDFTVPMRGEHHGRNAMLALAVCALLDVPSDDAARGLSDMSAPAMRGGWETIGAVTVINDAYNANPPSMRAALALLRQVGHGRQRVAVLGTMRELGAHSDAQHDAIAQEAMLALADGVAIVVAVGEFAEAFARVAPGDARIMSAPDPEAAWTRLEPELARDAMVLLKGSRGVRLERVLPLLTSWATA